MMINFKMVSRYSKAEENVLQNSNVPKGFNIKGFSMTIQKVKLKTFILLDHCTGMNITGQD